MDELTNFRLIIIVLEMMKFFFIRLFFFLVLAWILVNRVFIEDEQDVRVGPQSRSGLPVPRLAIL